ncbi:MAG: flagellar biosynthetic protein FliR, partial [Myxococcota bacterium]
HQALLWIDLGYRRHVSEARAQARRVAATAQPAAVAGCLSLGVQLAAPVVSMVWLIHVWIALLSKLAPRMHAFFSVGTTLTGAVGVGMLAVSLPWLITIHAARMTDAVAELGRRIVGT